MFNYTNKGQTFNAVSKADSYPIPRVDLIDKVSSATYLTKFDLCKRLLPMSVERYSEQ